MPRHYPNPLFNARSVAVFGASERADSVAGTLYRNLHHAGCSGGPGVMATNRAVDTGVGMAELAPATLAALDGVRVMLTPQAMMRPTEVAAAVVDVAKTSRKPVLACRMGEAHAGARGPPPESSCAFAQDQCGCGLRPLQVVRLRPASLAA